MAANPMTQFEVYRIGPEIKIGAFDISFTNASLFMVISSLAILIIFNLGSKKNSMLPNKIQLLAELSYSFVSKMISDTAGSKAKPYFAFIFSLFMFVLFCNMFGMIPYTFTVTSHIIVTFVLAAFIFIGVTIIGFIKHGFGYLKLFVPSGVPIVLLPLIVVIEIISYLSRPISLISKTFCKHDGRSHYDESFRRLCNKSWNSRWMASTEFFGCFNRFGDLSCFSSSICFCNLNMYLFK